MNKKFEIRKKFEIQKPEKKKFEINDQTETRWFKQENANDCGPSLILNSLNFLDIPHRERSLTEIREAVNVIRREEGRQELSPDGWFNSFDVGEYLSRQGLSVAEYSCSPAEREEVRQNLRTIFDNKEFDIIYTTTGGHFRAIGNDGEQVVLLDSFLSDPRIISTAEAW